jgi:hypothetical protein
MNRRYLGILAAIFGGVIFLAGCGGAEQQQVQQQQQPVYDTTAGNELSDDYWAKDNFDLQRVGDLLERSHGPEEFERYLNRPGGINNLDLNGDGYVDYVSVREFDDRDPYERGLSLYSQYGPDLIQEIATIFFYRDEPRYPGARILLRGDERLYGDNIYYERNWLDRSLEIASFLFRDHDSYRSPYYYDNYPTWYETYEVVETPVYRTHVAELYPQPVFVAVSTPEIVDRIKIKSPNNGLHLGQIKAKLVKPTREQEDFIKNNPRSVRAGKGDKVPRPDDAKRREDNPGRGRDDNPGRGNDPARLGPPQHAEDNPGRKGDPQGPKRGPDNPKGGPPSRPAQADNQKGRGQAKPDKPGKGPGQNKGGNNGKGGGKGKKG